MANRRMFSKLITNSSKFLMMPASAQALYFHIGMNADDDGYCEIFTLMKMTDAKPDDFKILAAKKFIHLFDEHILIILDWKKNNYLRNDRYSPSKYKDLYRLDTTGIPTASDMDTSKGESDKQDLSHEAASISSETEKLNNINEITFGVPTVHQMDTTGVPTVHQMDTTGVPTVHQMDTTGVPTVHQQYPQVSIGKDKDKSNSFNSLLNNNRSNSFNSLLNNNRSNSFNSLLNKNKSNSFNSLLDKNKSKTKKDIVIFASKKNQPLEKNLDFCSTSANPSSLTEQSFDLSNKPKNGNGKEKIPYQEIIDYFNLKANTHYRATTPETQRLIQARWKAGFRIDDFKTVIDNMVGKWGMDPKMQAYIRPVTLFGSKFENYLNTKVTLSDRGIVSAKTERNMAIAKEWAEEEVDI